MYHLWMHHPSQPFLLCGSGGIIWHSLSIWYITKHVQSEGAVLAELWMPPHADAATVFHDFFVRNIEVHSLLHACIFLKQGFAITVPEH